MIEALKEVMHGLVYVTHVLLSLGILHFIVKGRTSKNFLTLGYFIVLLLIEVYAFNNRENNLFIFSITSFLHFAFLLTLYSNNFLKISIPKLIGLIVVGAIPMILSLTAGYTFLDFQSYDRVFYSFAIMLLSLYCFYLMLNEEILPKKEIIVLNSFVLLFFSIDTFLAIGTNYLINESLMLVAWFWFFRAIFLQFYYVSLIYYSWQIGKTR